MNSTPSPAPFAPDRSFWKGKRVLVTGHTGFKGSWLTYWLHLLGADVTGYSLPCETKPSMFEALQLARLCRHVEGDIRDASALSRTLKKARPEIVLHLAAQPLVRLSYEQPSETFAANVQGTVNLLESCRKLTGLRAVIAVTTDKCYENREWAWSYRECDPLGGRDPYSASKACAELVVQSFRQSFFHPSDFKRHGVAVASARAGNVFAGGDWSADRLIPDMARAFSRRAIVKIRNPHAVRPWQFVTESLSGYLMLARACVERGPDFAIAWNFGPADHQLLTVGQVVERFAGQWSGARTRIATDAKAPHEANLLLLDSGLARRRLQWHPRFDFDQAIAATAAWYKAFYAGASTAELRRLTEQQILHGPALSPDGA